MSLQGSEVMDLLESRTKAPNKREMHCIKPRGTRRGSKSVVPWGLSAWHPCTPAQRGNKPLHTKTVGG